MKRPRHDDRDCDIYETFLREPSGRSHASADYYVVKIIV